MSCCLIFPFQLAQQQQQQPTGHVDPGLGAPPAAPGLDALRGDPRLNAIRDLATQNPGILQPMIQQLAQTNPQLAAALASDPASLLQLLGEGDGEVGDDGEPIPPGAHVVNVTPEERAAIERVRFLPNLLLTSPDLPHSWRPWAFPDRLPLRRILHVIKTKS
jgi:UV excision repair protein RAD23